MRPYLLLGLSSAVSAYTWASVKTGGGGGFSPGIVFNPGEEGIAYLRTDIGGAYRLNSDDSWTPITDFVNDTTWDEWGINAIAADPVVTSNVYLLVGTYTNDWDPNNAAVLRSSDYGTTWARTALPFKVGGNEPGRGIGERLVIDPNNNKIIYLAAPGGNGLYKSTDAGVTFSKVSSFTNVGTYAEDPTDTTGYSSNLIGLTTVVFDTNSGTTNGATSRIFVGVANLNTTALYVSNDAGSTWSAVTGQPTGRFPRRIKFSKAEASLYLAYDTVAGPYDNGDGKVYRYAINSTTWTDITPAWETSFNVVFGYGGLALDAQNPGTVVVAADNLWWPDAQIFRSTDSGATWSTLWEYTGTYNPYYTWDTSNAPWIKAMLAAEGSGAYLGWMIESLEIDPFDSDHWLYGTGLSVWGGHDLTDWPAITVKSLANGIEEMSVQALISPPGGPPLISAVGDDNGFVHTSLTTAPTTPFTNPIWSTCDDLDYAGNAPKNIVRIGNSGSDGVSQIAVSSDSGSTWSPLTVTSTSIYGGHVAYSANATSIVWVSATQGVFHYSGGSWTSVSTLSQGATIDVIAADKVNNNYFYAADASHIYVSTDGGATFTATATSSGTQSHIEVHPTVAGDVWLSTSTGLYHSTDFGKTWKAISGITQAYAIALGKGSGSYPNVYAYIATATSGGNILSLSTDQGATWTEIQDATHGLGSGSANSLGASQDTAGLVFVGTNGRGIFYGLPSGSSGTSTTTSKTTSSTTTSKVTTTSSTSIKTTTSSTTLKTTTTTSSATSTASTVPKYGQCGGSSYSGSTVCAAGSTCTYQNDFYSQCL